MGETVVLHLLLTTDTTSDRKKWWVAQGLELDLVAMGESPQEAQADGNPAAGGLKRSYGSMER